MRCDRTAAALDEPAPFCLGCVQKSSSGRRWYVRTSNSDPRRLACSIHRRWLVYMDHVPRRWEQLIVGSISDQVSIWQLTSWWSDSARESWSSADELLEALSRPVNAAILDDVRWQLRLMGWPVASRPIDRLWGGTILTPDPARRTVVLATIALVNDLIPLVGRRRLRATLL